MDFQGDVIEYEILEDGTVKFTTDAVSAPNHASAEEFFRYVAKTLGGETTRARRTDRHGHTHHHHDHVKKEQKQ